MVGGKVEARSANARNVILKYDDKLYHVDKVNVQYSEEKQKYSAVFRAKRVGSRQLLNLDFEISQKLYDVLVDYTKLDDSDLLLVLYVEDGKFKWSFVSDSWVQQQTRSKASWYVV
ncbi:MAG: hypothetical protein NWF06_03335 [Candidatus Bathyarchaeota archaeon]|nr:hypothetical protein [Candidatus Bathyarchaeum sp.]